jgi:hypothetical protein
LLSGEPKSLEPVAAWTPVILGGLYLALVMGLLRRSLGWASAIIGGLLVALSKGYHATFQLGHCDHHCLIELFQWVALAALWPRREGNDSEPTRAGTIVSGLSMGMALWVAAQAMLVWAALWAGLTIATFVTPLERRAIWVARARQWNVTVLAVLITGWLIEQWPTLLRPEMDKISLFHVVLGLLAVIGPVGRRSPSQRMTPRYAVFALGAFLFVLWFAAYRTEMTAIFVRPEFYRWSAVIVELQPLYLHGGGDWSIAPIAYSLGYLPFALPFLLPFFLKSNSLNPAAKTTLLILAPIITILSILQVRWGDHFCLAVMPVAVIALHDLGLRILRWMNIHSTDAMRIFPSAFAAVVLAGLAYPSVSRTLSATPRSPPPYAIRAILAADAINKQESQERSGPGRRAIMADQEAGPPLLYHTGLPILAAPYHRALDGQLEVARFYADRDVKTARQQIDRLGVKYVISPNEPVINLRIMERIAFGEARSYGPTQYKIEDGELLEGVSPLPEIEQTMAVRLYASTGLEGLRVRSVARAKEFRGPQELLVGFVYVVSPSPTSSQRAGE